MALLDYPVARLRTRPPREGIQAVDGEEASPLVKAGVVFLHHIHSISMEGGAGMGGLMAEGGVAEVNGVRVCPNYLGSAEA